MLARSTAAAKVRCAVDPVEKLILEAQERGDFDNLPGAGKPLDLSENPLVPEDWRMAYRLLARSGYAPDVVEADKENRARILQLEQRFDQFARRWQALSRQERRAKSAEREAWLAEYLEEIRQINRQINVYNSYAPRAMHRGTLLPEAMLQAARARLFLD
jgi:DnaJ family protein C protein 28